MSIIKIKLPASKSLSNRALIIRALSHNLVTIKNLSDANDTIILKRLLDKPTDVINVEDAGTAYRFLTAYFALQPLTCEITGSKRLLERPIKPLVDALRSLGAKIQYLNKENQAPIKIIGGLLENDIVEIDVSESSQYASALMLIGPYLNNGLTIELKGDIVSEPYLKATAQLMKACGAEVAFKNNKINVGFGFYTKSEIYIEADWSSAAFFYMLCALHPKLEFSFQGLSKNSLQGDSYLAEIFTSLGIETKFGKTSATISNSGKNINPPTIIDFSQQPDLALPLIVLYAELNLPLKINGVAHLSLKESNRMEVLSSELKKLGKQLVKKNENEWDLLVGTLKCENPVEINTHNDHRITMSFAILQLKYPAIKLSETSSVIKSFPGFWEEFRKVQTAMSN